VLLVEASKMEGDGELVLTGHLGDVMKESAKLALNWVRTSAREVRHTQFSLLLPESSTSALHAVVSFACSSFTDQSTCSLDVPYFFVLSVYNSVQL